MHLVVAGAGALGTLFGASAWMGGNVQVTLVGRGDHVRVINDAGVLLTDSQDGETWIGGPGLRAVTDLKQVDGAVDYLLFSVKDRDLDRALEDARILEGRVGCVLSLLNGVDQEDRIGEVFGADVVVGSLTMEGASMTAPGVIEHILASTTYLGEFSGARTERVEVLAEALRRGHLHTEVVPDIAAAKWTKFVQICGASGLCGVSRVGYATATRTEAGARLYVRLVNEGAAVMRARGLEPGAYFTDAARVKEIANMAEDDAVAMVRGLAEDLLQRGYTGSTSLARDLQAGRPSEVEALMGSMFRAGERLGIETPTMRAVYWAIKAADESNMRA
jgi:2-dehydropantoate 2-reductase